MNQGWYGDCCVQENVVLRCGDLNNKHACILNIIISVCDDTCEI